MRIVTWNLNRVEHGSEAFRIAAEYLATSGADAIALQLASRDTFERIARVMGWPVESSQLCIPDESLDPFGNAVLTRYRVKRTEEYVLPSPANLPGRSALAVEIQVPEHPSGVNLRRSEDEHHASALDFIICSVHLDNVSEDARTAQAQRVSALLGSHSQQDDPARPSSLLCGDTNGLLRRDYTPAAWSHLSSVAAQRGWEPRGEAAMRSLLDNAGYIDAFDSQQQASSMAPQPQNQDGNELDKQRDTLGRYTFFLPPADAWIRLDYILLSRSFPGCVLSCRCNEVPGVSNHHPVIAEIALDGQGSTVCNSKGKAC